MHPSELATFFQNFADLLEIRGREEDGFPIIAYRRAVDVLQDHEGDILKLIKEEKLHTLPGIGKGIEVKAKELIDTGKVKEYEVLKKQVPESVLDLLRIPSLGPKKASALFNELKVKDIEGLKKAIGSGKAEKLPRFGKKTVEKFTKGMKMLEKMKGRTLLGDATIVVEALLKELKKCKEITKMEVAGSFRRREETVGDIDILTTVKDTSKVADFITSLKDVEQVLGKGDTKISVLLNTGLQVDVRMIEPKSYGAALQYFTGSKAHNVELRTYAKENGFKINEYGIFPSSNPPGVESPFDASRESAIYETLKMNFIPPELRQANGEIKSALDHKLPDLIELEDIKGDLHVHSSWSSDAKGSIEEMAKTAEDLGYEYICITDHSVSIGIAAGPKTKTEVIKKKKEIEKAQKKLKIKILCGTEVDIKSDGSLDYSDDILKEMDFVIAAIHSSFDKDNTDRLISAINHPLVHAIAHPTGRLLGKRNAYPFDEDKVYKEAKKNNVWLEINAHPSRLDLPSSMCRKAKAAGCKFIINTDAHRGGGLSFMHFGVSTASRGWIEKSDVVNTMPLKKFLGELK